MRWVTINEVVDNIADIKKLIVGESETRTGDLLRILRKSMSVNTTIAFRFAY